MFTLKELVPDAFATSIAFKPDPVLGLEDERFWIQSLPEEAKAYAWAAILAENDFDYSYNEQMLWEFGVGAAGITFLHSALLAGRVSYQHFKKGLPIDEAVTKGGKEVAEATAPQMDQALQDVVISKAREDEILITRDIENKIELSGSSISNSIKAGGNKFRDVRGRVKLELERIGDELELIPDDEGRVVLLEGEISDLNQKLGIKTDADINTKLNQAVKQLKADQKLADETNVWTRAGWKKFTTRINTQIDKIEDLKRLQDFKTELAEANLNVKLREAKALEVAKLLDEVNNSNIGFANALNDGRLLLSHVDELVEQRGSFIDLQASDLVRDPKYPDITSTGTYHEFPGPLGVAYRKLTEIIQTADTAIAGDTLDDALITELTARADEVKKLISENGGLKPIVSEAVDSDSYLKKSISGSGELKKASVKTKNPIVAEELDEIEKELAGQSTVKAPIDQNPETGNYEINKDEVGARRGAEPNTPTKAVNIAEEASVTNKELGIDQAPDPEDLHKDIVNKLDEESKLQELDDIDGGNRVEQSSSLSRTTPPFRTDGKVSRGANAGKITDDPKGKALLTNKIANVRKANLNPQLYAQAVRQLGRFIGGSAEVLTRKKEFLDEAIKVGSDFYEELPKVIVTMSLIKDSTESLLRAVRDVRQVNAGINISMSKEVAIRNFLDNYRIFNKNLTAVAHFYQGVGNAMRMFGPAGRVQIWQDLPGVISAPADTVAAPFQAAINANWADPRKIKVAVDNLGTKLKNLGDDDAFAEALMREAADAELKVNTDIEAFLKAFDEGKLTDKQIDGIENLVEQLEASKGNLAKLKETQMSSREIMATLHSGHVLSNVGFPFSIPMMGHIGMAGRLAARTGQYYFSAATEALLVKRGLGSAEEMARLFKKARHSRRWLMKSHMFFGEGLETAKNSFLFNKALTDPKQVRRADLSMTASGLSREEAIIQSLKGNTEHNTIWAKWLLNTFKNNPKIVKSINEAITFGKVFHDYTIPGEAWALKGIKESGEKSKLHRLADWPVDLTRTVTGKFRGEGFGSKSYFPQGERVNLSLFQQMASAGDEAITAQYMRASLYADAMELVDNKVANGAVAPNAYKEAVKEQYESMIKGMNSEIGVGFDQETIGNAFLDERGLELLRQVNQTEELTGPLGSVRNAVEMLRNDENPAVSFSARFIWPIINSPLVAIKQAVRYAYGLEMARLPISLTRAGAANLSEKLLATNVINDIAEKNPAVKNLLNKVAGFESHYLSPDPIIRDKARNSFAIAAGIQATVAAIIWDPNSEITGGLDDTYGVALGRAERFRWNVGGVSIPYRYIPLLGEAMAFQITLRDIIQHNPDYDGVGLMNVMSTGLATQIMDIPAFAGMSTVFDALERQKEGDPSAILKIAQQGWARISAPYTEGKKSLTQMLDNRKAVTTIEKFEGAKAFKRGKLHQKDRNTLGEITTGVLREVASVPALTFENELALLTDGIYQAFANDPDYRLSTRRAVPFGRPEETVRSSTAPWYVGPINIFGRYKWGNNDLNDPVNRAIVDLDLNLPDNSLFNSYDGKKIGLGINDRELNNFNHFFNTEYTFVVNGKTYVGINAYIRDRLKDPQFTKYDETDSPYKLGSGNMLADLTYPGLFTTGNWVTGDKEDVDRRTILNSDIKEQINKAKIQYVLPQPDQRFQASESLKELVLEAVSGGL